MDDGLVEMVVESVRVHMLSSRHVVILKEAARDRYLPIWIGPWEASAIAMKLQGLTPERPLTHDLFATTLEELGARIERVIISDLADETFHARILLERDGRTVEIDARPSDALALAVRSSVRIFAAAAVLEQAALGGDGGILDVDEGGEGSTLEATGEGIVDPRLDVFRDFVNSLDADAEGEGRSS
jgi:bifunctional DNase/RNase